MIIIIDDFCIALSCGVHKVTALYNILQHFLSEEKMNMNNEKDEHWNCYKSHTHTHVVIDREPSERQDGAHIVGDSLKPRNSVFPVLRGKKKVLKIQF